MTDAPLMLGVSGARGIVGASMTEDVARRFAACWGARLAAGTSEPPIVCLGRDSRPSGVDLARAAAQGLGDAGCRVVDLGLVATPTVGVMIGAIGAAGGVVVTASHNPTPWNGLKLLDEHGTAPAPDLAGEVIEAFAAEAAVGGPPVGDITVESRGTDTHVAKVLGQIDPMPLRDQGFTVVLDSVNGAGCAGGALLLDALGCTVVHLGDTPDGNFPHEPEPVAEHLKGLCQAVVEHGADAGFAQDPDADRLAIVDEQGRYIGEEYTLVLATWRVLLDVPESIIVTNLSTSRMIDDLATRHGAVVHRSAVGEANVAAMMRQHGATIGGEGNGGVILPGITWVRDSLSGMALVLDLVRREGQPLSALVDTLPRYVIVKEKLDLPRRKAIVPVLARLRRGFADAELDESDGLRIDLPQGWIHVRPSNTEPIARIIAEADSRDAAVALIDRVREVGGF